MASSHEVDKHWISKEYPLHWLAWNDSFEELNVELAKKVHNIEARDPRGRTALHVAVSLGHADCAAILLKHGANANAINSQNWTVLQEAVSTADPEVVRVILKYRDNQRMSSWFVGIPELLQKINDTPDFYVEMKWEFTSWVPLVSRMCPSDTYKVYKCGPCVRIDTTLLGFDNTSWERGNRSYIFKGDGNSAVVMEVDHDRKEVYTERLSLVMPTDIAPIEPSEDSIAARLTSPLVTTNIDTDKIAFESVKWSNAVYTAKTALHHMDGTQIYHRNKSGIFGWRSDKNETIDNFDCKVFSAVNVELATKRRTEHLSAAEKEQLSKVAKTPIESFLGAVTDRTSASKSSDNNVCKDFNPSSITPEEYFDERVSLDDRDIGRPKDETTKVQKFKATLSLCENYPLSLQEQVIPIIDLMARSNAHFQKLRDFITLQLPAGFPIKIEIPLYHILNARVTFGNIYSSTASVPGVHRLDDDTTMSCTIDSHCFDVPADVQHIGGGGYHGRLRDEDDELLNFAVQQSLMETGTENDQVTFMEALSKSRPQQNFAYSKEEIQMQRAIAASMMNDDIQNYEYENLSQYEETQSENGDDELLMAIQMSEQESENARKQRELEEAELEMILKLSLTEK